MAVTGNVIAADALRYVGDGYTYGGDASRPGNWDCSSFVSYVLGHDLKMALPGGRWGDPGFPPNAHGPVVLDYAAWTGAETVSQPARGDLVCFVGSGPNGHIGIVLAADKMVSALNTQVGVVRTPIAGYGPPGAPIVYRHVKGTPGAVPAQAAPAATGKLSGSDVLVPLLMIGGVLVGAVLFISLVVPAAITAGTAAAGGFAARQAGKAVTR